MTLDSMQPATERMAKWSNNQSYELFSVAGPDMSRDKLVAMFPDGVDMMSQRFGAKPSRSSISRWRNTGYPVDRNGPRVLLPYAVRLKQVYTSVSALTRWFEVITQVGNDLRAAGGVTEWRRIRQKGSR